METTQESNTRGWEMSYEIWPNRLPNFLGYMNEEQIEYWVYEIPDLHLSLGRTDFFLDHAYKLCYNLHIFISAQQRFRRGLNLTMLNYQLNAMSIILGLCATLPNLDQIFIERVSS